MEKRGDGNFLRVAAAGAAVEHVHHEAGVLEHVSFGMELGGLAHPVHAFDFREKMPEETARAEKPESVPRIPAGEYLDEFFAYSLPAHDGYRRGLVAYGRKGRSVDLETET